jgi:hypothetical protein
MLLYIFPLIWVDDAQHCEGVISKLGRFLSVRERETTASKYKVSECSRMGDDRFVYFQQTTFLLVFADGLGERSSDPIF